jgi:hypothetical protein
VLAAWGYSKERLLEGANPIALLKAATVLVVAPVLFEVLPNRSYVCFIDNTVGLHSLEKVVSGNPFMEHTVQLFHLLALFFKTVTWFQYVPSGQNWSDGLSRNGPTDQWIVAHGVPCSSARAPLAPWRRTLAEFWQGWSDGNPLEAFREYIGS